MKRMTQALALVAALTLTANAHAEVLWDQSTFDPFGPGFFNSESGEPPLGITMHTVSDVTVDGGGWTIDSITTYFSSIDPGWGFGIVDGYVHVFPKTGPLPVDGTDDPTMSAVVAMTGTFVTDHIEVSVSGLNITLAPGEYWIGITPIAPSGFFGPEIQLSSIVLVGDSSPSYDPFGFPTAGWLNFTPDADATIRIEGERSGPVPTHETTWGRLKSDVR